MSTANRAARPRPCSTRWNCLPATRQSSEGEIVISPPPDEEHEETFAEIDHQFNTRGRRVSGNHGLATHEGRLGRFLPDLTVAPREFFARRTGESRRSPEGVALVVEITSTNNPGKDRDAKRRGYAAAGIPLYLLVDRGRQETVLFTDPQHGDYRRALPHPPGQAHPPARALFPIPSLLPPRWTSGEYPPRRTTSLIM